MKKLLIAVVVFCSCTGKNAELLKQKQDITAQIRKNMLDSLAIIDSNSHGIDSLMHIEMKLDIHDIKANDSIVHIIDSVKAELMKVLAPRIDSIRQLNLPLRIKYDSITAELKKDSTK